MRFFRFHNPNTEKVRLRGALKRVTGLWRRYRLRIVYYAAVAAVLIAIAAAAEGYRGKKPNAGIEPANRTVSEGAGARETDAPEDLFKPRLPDTAEVIRGYSEAPVFSDELRQWEIHCGTDIRFLGNDVPALCAGEVVCIDADAMYGQTVDVRSGENTIRYMGVRDISVRVGDRVTMGDIIARQDDRVRSEAHLGAHVHIEVYAQGACIDLADCLAANDD